MKNQLSLNLCYVSLGLHLLVILFIGIGLQDKSPVRIFINGNPSSAKFVKSKHFKSFAVAGNINKNKSYLAKKTGKAIIKKSGDIGKSLLKRYADLNFKDYSRSMVSKDPLKNLKSFIPESNKNKKIKVQVKAEVVKESINVEKMKPESKIEKPLKIEQAPRDLKKEESEKIVEDVEKSLKNEVVVPETVDAVVDVDVNDLTGDDSGVTVITENVDFRTANRFSREFGKHLKAVKLYREFSLPVKFNILESGAIENVSFPQGVGTKVDQIAIIRALRQIDFNKSYPMLCGREMSLVFNRNEKGNISVGGGDNL